MMGKTMCYTCEALPIVQSSMVIQGSLEFHKLHILEFVKNYT